METPAYAENYDFVADTGPVAVTFGRDPTGKIRYWINGTEFTDWDDTADSSAPFDLSWHMLQCAPGTVIKEMIVFDEYVGMDGCCDLDGLTTLRQYLTGRYPSLFGGG